LKSARLQKRGRSAVEVSDEALVMNRSHAIARHAFPMRHESRVLAIVVTNMVEAIGEGLEL
jgi:hypothetical protein